MNNSSKIHPQKRSSRILKELEQGQKIAEKAEDIWGFGSPAGQIRADRRTALLIQYGKIRKASSVLEVGCGTGGITRRLAKSGAQITATDLSHDLLVQASLNSNFQNVNYQIVNAENLSFHSQVFNVVVGSAILHHLDPLHALKEFYRVLKVGGRIVFCEPNMLNPQIGLQKNWRWLKEKMGDTPDETAFFTWKIKQLLFEIGYQNVCVRPFDFLHPAIPRGLIEPIQKLEAVLEKIPFVKQIAGSILIVGYKPK